MESKFLKKLIILISVNLTLKESKATHTFLNSTPILAHWGYANKSEKLGQYHFVNSTKINKMYSLKL